MPYAIQTRDKTGSENIRSDNRAAHLEYLTKLQNLILAGGAITDDDGTGGRGGIIIIDTDDRAEAERFVAEDPFTKAGLFEEVTVSRWRKAFFNKERLV
jgi:uncharacterized protein YciI